MRRARFYLAGALAAMLAAAGTMPVLARGAPASPPVPSPAAGAQVPGEQRPNFLIIVADDLGFSDLGAFGGEIDTPNLDALARQGLRLTGFHSAPTCSPTRSMLLSGTDHHRAGLGNMAEMVSPNQKGRPGYEGYLSPNVASLAERLAAGGYRTLMSGKWHLGTAPDQDPHRRGFQQSFALLQGGHNHFGLGIADTPAKGSVYTRDGQIVTNLPADFYSSDYFTDQLLSGLSTSSGSGKPFFAYLTFTAPHWPLQAPASDIAKYHGRYDAGFEVLRQQRLKRQAELGLIDPTRPAATPVLRTGDWNSLSPQEKAEQSRRMEIYAAMVDRLDRNVGRVVDYLKRTGQFENTVILFTSDNGAEGMDVREGRLALAKVQADAADNRPENFGKATSYLSAGPGWAQAATAPSRLFKAYTTEGGTRVAAFLTYAGVARQGAISDAFGTVQDVVPTFLDLASLPAPTTRFEGRKVEPVRGVSWTPYLEGKTDRVHSEQEAVGWELFGHRALRQGDWKLVGPAEGGWQLFNLRTDPGETQDLATEHPARLKQLIAAWEKYAREVGVVLPDRSYKP